MCTNWVSLSIDQNTAEKILARTCKWGAYKTYKNAGAQVLHGLIGLINSPSLKPDETTRILVS